MFFCLFFLLCLCVRLFICALWSPAERADLLAPVCGVFCEFGTFPLVSWVMCGTLLYRFLIIAPLLTLTMHKCAVAVERIKKRIPLGVNVSLSSFRRNFPSFYSHPRQLL